MLNNKFLKTIKLTGIAVPLLVLFIFSGCSNDTGDKTRSRVKFNADWKFARGDFETAQQAEFNDEGWRTLDQRVRSLLKAADMNPEHPMYNRILERIAFLDAADAGPLHAVTSRLLKEEDP